MSQNYEGWMQTVSGEAYRFVRPIVANIKLSDIAHSLSNICRFNGHSKYFYSVAEHSVLVSYCVEPSLARQALMHDATEYAVGDVTRPLKQLISTEYTPIESASWVAISLRFGLPRMMHKSIKDADNRVLLAERNRLLKPPPIPWTWADDIEPAKVKVRGLPPFLAKLMFLARYHELSGVSRQQRITYAVAAKVGIALHDLFSIVTLRELRYR